MARYYTAGFFSSVRCYSIIPNLRAPSPTRTDLGYRTMTTVVFSIQHAGAPKLEEIVVEVHPEWAPIGAQCVRPATAA